MSIGVFTDKGHLPTMEEIFETLGPKGSAWKELTQSIRENYSRQEELKFYGKNYGWALRFGKGGKALVSLYPAKDAFTIQLILSEYNTERALTLGLCEHVRQIIEQAHPYPEGRSVFIPVESEGDIRDAQQLLNLKAQSTPKPNR